MAFTYDISELKNGIKKVLSSVDEEAKTSMTRTAEVFASAAARWTPPFNAGKKTFSTRGSETIPKEKYFRPIINLISLVKGEISGLSANEIDRGQLRQGRRWKVLNTRNKSMRNAPAYAYCTTQAQAKRLARIETRGLAKVMWAKNINRIDGANVPRFIQKLISKSPMLEEINYNEASLRQNDTETTVEIENKATNIERYAAYAEKAALDIAKKELTARLKRQASKEHKI